MTQPLSKARVQWLPVAIALLCTAGLSLLLFTGVQRAARLQSASTALQLAAGLTAQPQLMRSELTLIQRGLETRTYVGDSLRTLDNSRNLSNQAYVQLAEAMRAAGLAARADTRELLAAALKLWAPLDRGLERLGGHKTSDLYSDSSSGSALTAAGARLKRSVDDLLATQTRNTAALSHQLVELSALLREAVVSDGRSLRALLLGGSGLAALLLASMLYFAWRRGQAAVAAGAAQRQVADIMGTVREGLFLIARDGRISDAHSDSLRELLRVATPAGQSFEDLLRPLVDDKTLLAAGKFLGLLWKDKVNEELIESVNPLNQIEVNFHKAHGAAEVRYLSFSFRRVRGGGASADHVFGVVADITDRVLLQRELEHLKSDTDSNSALLLQVLQVEPLQLQTFLGTLDATLRRSNTLLRTPGKQSADLQQKIQGVFREMHSLKGEAAALALGSFARRAHEVEDLLAELRDKPELAGNDFVPVVVRLDELMSHAQEVARLQQSIGQARSAAASAGDLPPAQHGDTAVLGSRQVAAALAAPPTEPAAALHATLQRLSADVSVGSGREVRLLTEGLEHVPASFLPRVREICIQMIRNAIAHGIETREQRALAGKPPVGTIRIRFSDSDAQAYSLIVEDDGRGLNPEAIGAHARDRGLLDAQQAAALDRSGAFRLLFLPGFSTVDQVSEHAGRGVGLDVVNAAVRDCGGRIGIATTAGKYTRFKMILPRAAAQSESQSSAA
ncbi:MAG: ATP-binding protein [Steroidobacteraceae bacterium]